MKYSSIKFPIYQDDIGNNKRTEQNAFTNVKSIIVSLPIRYCKPWVLMLSVNVMLSSQLIDKYDVCLSKPIMGVFHVPRETCDFIFKLITRV